MPFKFHKPQKSPKEPHPSPYSPLSETRTISLLHITLTAPPSRLQTTYSPPTAPSHPFNNNTYPIPPLLLEKEKEKEKEKETHSKKLHLLTLEFTRDYIPLHLKNSPEQQALCGVYAFFYFPNEERPKTAMEFREKQAEGEFWMLRQLQWRPEAGEKVVFEDVPGGMEEAMEGWWGRGVVLPRMRRAVLGMGRERGGE